MPGRHCCTRKHGNEFTLPAGAEPCPPGNCTEVRGLEHDRTTRIAHDREPSACRKRDCCIRGKPRSQTMMARIAGGQGLVHTSSFSHATGTGPLLMLTGLSWRATFKISSVLPGQERRRLQGRRTGCNLFHRVSVRAHRVQYGDTHGSAHIGPGSVSRRVDFPPAIVLVEERSP